MDTENEQTTGGARQLIPGSLAHTFEGEWDTLHRHFTGKFPAPESTVRAWEETLADTLGVPDAACVNSGRHAMTLIFERLNLEVGDEIIVPAYTLRDLVPLLERYGAKVVPADVDPRTMNVTVESVAKRMAPCTRAVMVLHAFGSPAPVEAVCDLAAKHGVPVIEDCAHALGLKINGRAAGTFGHAAFFSFTPPNPVHSFGGGLVVSKDADLVAHARQANHGYPVDLAGLESRVDSLHRRHQIMRSGLGTSFRYGVSHPLSRRVFARVKDRRKRRRNSISRYAPIQAHLAMRKFADLEKNLAARRHLAALYDAALPGIVRPQKRLPDGDQVFYQYVVRLPRDARMIHRHMLRRGVDSAVGEEVASNVATPLGYPDCPEVDRLFPVAMALPLYEGMTDAQVERVIKTLTRALEM